MATTPPPPDDQPTTVQPSSAYTVNVSDIARLPIPGNAEFGVWLLALIVAWLVCWLTDSLTANDWLHVLHVHHRGVPAQPRSGEGEPGARAVGSKRVLSRRRSSGTGVGYSRVRQARQKLDAGRRVAAWSPSSER